jgi:hypothetical protein
MQGAHEMILEMVAWRDPNLVSIKAFYGDDLKVNFCGKLATDPHLQVGNSSCGWHATCLQGPTIALSVPQYQG